MIYVILGTTSKEPKRGIIVDWPYVHKISSSAQRIALPCADFDLFL